MILQALKDYYLRLQNEGIVDLPDEGFQKQPIPFLIVLDRQGKFKGFIDTREGEGKKKSARVFTVPKAVKRTTSIVANLLWDTPAYVLGRPKPDAKIPPDKIIERAAKQKQSFILTIRERLAPLLDADEGIKAVIQFLERGDFESVFSDPAWPEIEAEGANLSFQLEGDTCLICERPAVRQMVASEQVPSASSQTCLVSGEMDEPTRLHTAIKGVRGAQSSGANIVSFNLSAFTSYGKEQSFNAPVGKRAHLAYTTALNHLLKKGSRQSLQVGDASTVFWAEKSHEIENVFADFFGEQPRGEPEQDYKSLIAMFRSPETGAKSELDPHTRFFVLGLSPNIARIAVRFWYAGTVEEIAKNLSNHFDDIEIIHGPNQPKYLSLFRLLISTAALGKSENILPNMAGDFMKAILAGTPYPKSLLGAVILRCRAEREITYPRAALIKAVLRREARYRNQTQQEVGMALDTCNDNIGYRLGRLFATLEKIQEEANPDINATIRDRFYGSASATPVAAFAHLMKLKNYHLAKLENRGRAVNFERVISEIMDGINDFPAHLSLADQGRFAVGYYHQRQWFFTKKSEENLKEAYL
jgi:CRISPR-associated protein Csd1